MLVYNVEAGKNKVAFSDDAFHQLVLATIYPIAHRQQLGLEQHQQLGKVDVMKAIPLAHALPKAVQMGIDAEILIAYAANRFHLTSLPSKMVGAGNRIIAKFL
jgi:hypothetical protein